MGMGMGQHVVLARDLTVDDVRHFLDHRIQMQGYSRLSSPLKKASLTGFHATAKHIAAKAVSPSSETMRTI